MRDISIRTIGASLVLLGLAFAALLQMAPGGDSNAVALIPEETVTSTIPPVSEVPSPSSELSTTTSAPFTYRLGVLAGTSTNNFWAFYGQEPSVWNSYILGPTKPALFRVNPSSAAVEPEIAAWLPGPSFDGDSWFVEVSMRNDMAWSDGEPITAEDYVFTFETVRSHQLGESWAAAFPETITSVTATAAHRIRIDFAARPTLSVWPNGPGTAPIMPKHIWQDVVPEVAAPELYSDSTTIDVGGGPLALSHSVGNNPVSISNSGYQTEQGPDTVEYIVYPDEASLVDALIAGDVDAILTPNGISVESASRVQDVESIQLATSPANGIRYLGFNLERQPMSEPAFRRAMALLIDRESLAATAAGGSRPAFSLVREANTLWYDEGAAAGVLNSVSGDLQTRLTEAITGLREAGYAWQSEPLVGDDGRITPGIGLTVDGQAPAPLTILTPGDAYDPFRPAYVAEIAATLGALGFDARPVITDFDTVVDLAFTSTEDGVRQYDMYLLGWTLGNPALPDYYRPLFHSGGEMNNTGYSNAEFDERLAAYDAARTIDEARQQLWEMETILARDLPYLVLYSTDIAEAYRADRIEFTVTGNLGGIQGRLGGIEDVRPVSR